MVKYLLFQSSPAPKGGRYARSAIVADIDIDVSILARPEGRALRHCLADRAPSLQVSILARPEGRALHGMATTLYGLTGVSILARPEGRALPPPG